MDNKQKKILGISLIASAITMLFTLIIVPSKSKKTSRFLSVLALLEGLAGLFVATEEPRQELRRRRAEALCDDAELFGDDEADDAASAIHSSLAYASEGEASAPHLHIEIPTDGEAEADFI